MGQAEALKTDFKAKLAEKAELINNVLASIPAEQDSPASPAGQLLGPCRIPDELKDAIKYALQSPGKRLRGAVVLWCCELVAGKINDNAKTAAAAVEMVHTYSLVHDDLPAMDDDDLRRGQPSCHKAFGEATAILTGDGLLTMAFEILAKKVDEPAIAVKLIDVLATAAGPGGMIAGQIADLKSENLKGSKEMVQSIHTDKTAKMFCAAAVMGAIAGGATDEQLVRLSRFGIKIGLGFQIADDILDVSSSSEKLGKTVGKDAQQGKITYPAIVGMKEARRIAGQLADDAIASLEIFDSKADSLRQLVIALLERTR